MLEATIFTSTGVGVTIAFGSTRYFTAIQNVGRVKSSVDDLTMERGTVSMRVAFVLRSAEVQPLFRDLCDAPLRSRCQFSPPSFYCVEQAQAQVLCLPARFAKTIPTFANVKSHKHSTAVKQTNRLLAQKSSDRAALNVNSSLTLPP
jgi:hypothetical protein